jgi:hypothetical protein
MLYHQLPSLHQYLRLGSLSLYTAFYTQQDDDH